MNLLQRLQQANYNSTAISAGANISYTQLIAQALQLRQQYPALQHQAIALSYTDLSTFTCALLAFDGWCRALYLLPDNTLKLPEQVICWPENTPAETATPTAETTLWYLATSGTTGTPKWIAHSLTSLSRAAKASVQSAALRWALCYQPTRFAGLQVLLQSLLSGAVITDCSSGDAQQRFSLMQQHRVNAVSATPSLWRQLLMTAQLNTLALQQITLGGEIADQPLLDTLAILFPTARLLHIYASTEAGVGFAVADKRAGFPANWLNQRHSNLLLKLDANQHLWLKPPQQPDTCLATAVDSDGYLDSGDIVSIVQDRVVFLGRASGVINVGGNKVHPEQVEQVLLQYPGVRQAKVYAKASSVLGQLVTADIVVDNSTDSKALQAQLLRHCQQQLERYQLPARFNIVSSLATNATGKLSRKANVKEPHE
jgi:acyl-CoA synthetase (AMP-forming)/AMP-acid ligase II